MDNNIINVLIVNYNTQNFTEACIKSINKHTPGTKIYVFDNSDKEKFINNFSNVTMLDNTTSQIIDFNEILERYENKTSYGAESGFGTLKHALSVDKCFELIGDNFILLDSDVLIKKDISELYNDSFIYVGDERINGKSKKMRVSPHICFINVKKCQEHNIRYFDEKRIVGLSEEGDDYDTGSSFYFDCKGYESKKINESDWIVHYSAGSWINMTNMKKISPDDWLEKYKYLWADSYNNNDANIFINTHKEFKKIVNSDVYKVINAKEINPGLPLKDDFYSEFYQFKYISDNIPLNKYVGFCHYRRYFGFLDDIPNLDEIFSKYDCIVGKPMIFKMTVKEQYQTLHNIEDLYIVGGIIADKYPQHAKMWHNFINGNMFIPYNMFIMKSEDFKEYIKFVFDVLDEYLKIVGTDINKRIYDNYEKYIKDVYPNNTVDYQYRIGGYIGERLTNVFLMSHFKKMKTYPIIITEDKYKKKDE